MTGDLLENLQDILALSSIVPLKLSVCFIFLYWKKILQSVHLLVK